MITHYVLNDAGHPEPEPDLQRWGQWFASANRQIADDTIGPARISTVFLGLNHNHLHDDDPILFETMIFGGRHNHYQARYRTRDEALAGHATAVAMIWS